MKKNINELTNFNKNKTDNIINTYTDLDIIDELKKIINNKDNKIINIISNNKMEEYIQKKKQPNKKIKDIIAIWANTKDETDDYTYSKNMLEIKNRLYELSADKDYEDDFSVLLKVKIETIDDHKGCMQIEIKCTKTNNDEIDNINEQKKEYPFILN